MPWRQNCARLAATPREQGDEREDGGDSEKRILSLGGMAHRRGSVVPKAQVLFGVLFKQGVGAFHFSSAGAMHPKGLCGICSKLLQGGKTLAQARSGKMALQALRKLPFEGFRVHAQHVQPLAGTYQEQSVHLLRQRLDEVFPRSMRI